MATEILVVDDEAAIAGLVEVYLTNEGFSVHKALTAAEALEILGAYPIDLAILDVMLPDLDGFTLCQKIRETHLFPIIMLTARVEDMDKITGLTLGADDYITKPFNPLELVARVKTQLRPLHPLQPSCRRAAGGELRHPGPANLSDHPQVQPLRRAPLPDAPGVLHPLVPVQPPGPGGLQRGALRGRLGGEIHGLQQHRDEPYCPAAGETAREQPPAQVYQNRLGGGVHH